MIDLGLAMESTLLPFPDSMDWNKGDVEIQRHSTSEKIRYFAWNGAKLGTSLFLLPFVATFSAARSLGSRVITYFKPEPTKAPLEATDDDLASALPEHFGFADSLFQTSGLGTTASATKLEGISNWEKWLNPKRIEGTSDEEYRKFFTDVLKNPRPFIDILKKMGVTAHRFSLEWAVIEPEKGAINHEAIKLYRHFIKQLKAEGIEPYVTLHHFVLPEWFDANNGGFEQLENVDAFVTHSLKMMKLFPDVTNWMTFNEPGVYAFQSHARGVYPPGVDSDLRATGQVMRNLMIAHCKIYQEAKKRFGERVQIGITHQWLKFVPLEGNPLERLICYSMSKITHYAVYNFFKTGKFSLEVPTKANVQFSIPEEEFEKHNRFTDFIGVQFYGFPRFKMGFNGGEKYPGYKIINKNLGWTGFTVGSTCPKGGKAQSFGPGYYPESFKECLEEAAALKKPIAITETGCDAKIQKFGERDFQVDEETQRQYFKDILPILKRFQGELKAFFTWTLVRGHLEWDRGGHPMLGTVDIVKDKDRRIIDHKLSPAAELLQELYQEKRRALEEGAMAG